MVESESWRRRALFDGACQTVEGVQYQNVEEYLRALARR